MRLLPLPNSQMKKEMMTAGKMSQMSSTWDSAQQKRI
jgi:hypothetical protein